MKISKKRLAFAFLSVAIVLLFGPGTIASADDFELGGTATEAVDPVNPAMKLSA